MRKYRDIFEKYHLKPKKLEFRGNVLIVTCDDGKYVIKEKTRNSYNSDIFEYLKSRSFNYYPPIYTKTSDYEITNYIEEVNEPQEQKMQDLIDIISLLHNKTTFYQDINEDDYKKIYEDIKNNIRYLNSYYNDILEIIESHIYMSPSEFLFATNASKILGTLTYTENEIEKWLSIMKEKKKQRFVVLHNNLSLDHFLKNEDGYLISWDKAKIDIPIFDLYKLYKRNAILFDFSSLLQRYEKKYPLLEEERLLFFILISLPDRIEFTDNELKNCMKISQMIDYLYRTEKLLSPYYTKDRK